MKLLWIPHLPWLVLDGQRELRLFDAWPEPNDELHVLTWQPARGFGRPWESFRWSTFNHGRTTVHTRPRIPNLMGRATNNYAHGLRINEWLFQAYARQLARQLQIEVLVYGIGHTVVGLPPFDLPIAKAFDYLDLIAYPEVETAYVDGSDLVMCTSTVLKDRIESFGKPAVYVANGVSRARIARGDRHRTRRALGLEGRRVVSLIGLTSSPTLFFVDALAEAARELPDLTFLVVGGGDRLQPILERCQQLHLPVVATGWVSNSDIADYFAASDVGLYPGDANAYYDAACPIKVLEYTAAGRPVVATDLAELRRLAFPNVNLTQPSPDAFASAIVRAFRAPAEFPDLTSFEWTALARTVRAALADLVEERAAGVRRPGSLLMQGSRT